MLEAADLAIILRVFGGHRGFAVDDIGVRVRCPHCRYLDHNGPTGIVDGPYRIACTRCRRSFTRALIERLIVEDAELYAAFLVELGEQ